MDYNQSNGEVSPFLDPFEPPQRLPSRHRPPWVFIRSHDLRRINKIDKYIFKKYNVLRNPRDSAMD